MVIDIFLLDSVYSLIVFILIGAVTYLASVILLAKDELEWIFKSFKSWILKTED
jgi:hypothetical protein